MITEQDLQAAIAECKGTRNPDSSTCIKLAAFLIIQDHLYGGQEEKVYIPSIPDDYPDTFAEPVETTIDYQSDTEFSQIVDGKKASEIWPVIDELMEVLRVTTPRLYNGVMRKIQD